MWMTPLPFPFSLFHSDWCEAWCWDLDGTFHKCYCEYQCKDNIDYNYCSDTFLTRLFALTLALTLAILLQNTERIVCGLKCDIKLCVCALAFILQRWHLRLSKKRWGWLFFLVFYHFFHSKSPGLSLNGSHVMFFSNFSMWTVFSWMMVVSWLWPVVMITSDRWMPLTTLSFSLHYRLLVVLSKKWNWWHLCLAKKVQFKSVIFIERL